MEKTICPIHRERLRVLALSLGHGTTLVLAHDEIGWDDLQPLAPCDLTLD